MPTSRYWWPPLFSNGCSSKPKTTAEGKPVSGTDEQIFLGDTIEKNYDPNVIMKRGEAFFDKEEYAEAIVEFQHFLELHRAHQLAVYAQFRMAESHLRMANRSIATQNPSKKPFPPSKSYAKNSQAANMRDKLSSVWKTATIGWPRPIYSSGSFITAGLPILQRPIVLIRS